MGNDWGKWHTRTSIIEAKRLCECGDGEVLIKVDIEESFDQPVGKIIARYLEINCPNKCE
ncbi:hypothetical protein [Lysinibacillus endophyticus]|uniref:hypothetical protein n=1 Tax=Ureibacillus endophyticus TaxID=1978490 RepID=UPI0031375720